MSETLAEKIDTMLASVEEEVDDSDLAFKIRTARQMVLVYDDHLREHGNALDEAKVDDDTLENIRELGYLD